MSRSAEKKLRQQLRQLFKDADSYRQWLNTPNAVFMGMKPEDMLQNGEHRMLQEMLDQLEDGITS